MKTELHIAPHSVLPGAQVVEIWYDGKFIGQVCGADGPGVRIISKHDMMALPRQDPMIVEVKIDSP